MGTVAGAGNSSVSISYDAIDPLPFTHISYYRLRQVDFDGNFSFSQIVSVDNSFSEGFGIYPNPTQGEQLFVLFDENIDDNVTVSIRDIVGKEIYNKMLFVTTGNRNVELLLPEKLSSGIYFVSATSSRKGGQKCSGW